MRSTAIFLLLLLLLAVPAAYANDADGAELFKTNCTSCHGEDGKGTPAGKKLGAPNLWDDKVQDRSDKFLRSLVAAGRSHMPAFGEQLGSDQIVDVVIHVRSFWAPKQASAK